MRSRTTITFWLMIALAGLIGWGALASMVHQPAFTRLDFALTQQLHADNGGGYESGLSIIGEFGRSILVFVMLELTVWLWLRRSWSDLLGLLAVVGGGFVANYAARQIMAAPRLPLHAPFVLWRDTGFPSGHAMMATIAYGLLLWAVFPRIAREQRTAAVAGVAGLVLLVGYTRLYFGEHYLSDVAGGYLLGLAWLAACLAALTWRGTRMASSD